MFEETSQITNSKTADCCKNAGSSKVETDSSVNLLSATKKMSDCKGCPCGCGGAGGCCGGKRSEKNAGAKAEKDPVEKGIDYIGSAGYPKVAGVLRSVYEEGKSLLMPPLDCCKPKEDRKDKAHEGCPCGCGGAGGCCSKKPGENGANEKDKFLSVPPLDAEKDKAPAKKNEKKGENCQSCKCGCGGAGGCVCDSAKDKNKTSDSKDEDQQIKPKR